MNRPKFKLVFTSVAALKSNIASTVWCRLNMCGMPWVSVNNDRIVIFTFIVPHFTVHVTVLIIEILCYSFLSFLFMFWPSPQFSSPLSQIKVKENQCPPALYRHAIDHPPPPSLPIIFQIIQKPTIWFLYACRSLLKVPV